MRSSNDESRDEPEELACASSINAVAFLQGELLPETTARFARHIEECAICRQEVREAAETIGRLASLPEPNTEVDLVPRVMAEAARVSAAERARRTRRVRVLAGAVAASALVAAGLVWLHAIGARNEAPRHEVSVAALPESSPPVSSREPSSQASSPEPSPPAASSRAGVEQACDWLARAQEPSGAWSARRWGGQPLFDVALTGLAVLALLNDDGGASSPEARDASTPRAARDRALAYLISAQERDGRFGPEFAGALYNHAIATAALIEAFGCLREERLRAPIDRALAYIRACQAPAGGWGYLGAPGEEPNTALTCWPLQALLLARALGWQGLDEAIRGGFAHLARVSDGSGRLGYRRAGDFAFGTETLAPMGALCVLMARDAASLPGDMRGRILDAIMRAGGGRKKTDDLYRDFFLTAALEALPAARGGYVPEDALRALRARQVQAGAERGSWEPRDRWGSIGGRVYTTAVAALILKADERAQRLTQWVTRS